LTSGKPIGSARYLELPPILQEVAMKLSLASIDILYKNEKNPFKKLRYKIAAFATKKFAMAGKQKAELKKEKEKKKAQKEAAKKEKEKNKNSQIKTKQK
jgi:hypothetical protein